MAFKLTHKFSAQYVSTVRTEPIALTREEVDVLLTQKFREALDLKAMDWSDQIPTLQARLAYQWRNALHSYLFIERYLKLNELYATNWDVIDTKLYVTILWYDALAPHGNHTHKLDLVYNFRKPMRFEHNTEQQ